MEMKDYVPVISTLLGGALTTLGGFLASYHLQKITKNSERRALILARAEELYILCDEVIADNNHNMKEMTYISGESQKTSRSFERLSMIVDLYFVSLKPHSDEIREARGRFAQAAICYHKETLESGKPPIDKFEEALGSPYIAIDKSCRALQKALVAHVQNDIAK